MLSYVKDPNEIRIIDENGLTVARLGPSCEDDARRLVASYNECIRFPVEALEKKAVQELLTAARYAINYVDPTLKANYYWTNGDVSRLTQRLHKAINAFRPGGDQ